MADVTIGNLPPGIALGQCFVPLSDTLSTVKVRVSALQVDYANITSKPTIPAAQIQSDWTQTNTAALDYIRNKPAAAAFSTMVSLATVGTNLTWSKPAGITHIKVTVIGAGGGGGGFYNNAQAGGASVFDTAGINVTGGGGAGAVTSNGGSGGTSINGSVNITGAAGCKGPNSTTGGSGFGAYGVGGYGSILQSNIYSGGGGGGTAIRYMTVPSAVTNYLYTIGAGGASATLGTSVGAAGTQGIILIEY